ncbi:MAG: TaqI-like C-terminal specificity domain-containing protein [Nitrospirota bacterium]
MRHNKLQQDFFSDIWITSGIFSNHYLLECLPLAGSTVWPSDEEVLPIYKAIREIYEKNIVGLRKGNEANTERRFIDKVFNKLGFGYLNQDKIPEAERRQVPDYFLYSTPNKADKAFELRAHEKYGLAISIAEAKRWDHNLNQPSSGTWKAPKGRYPHQQIRDYINESEQIKWGILTNGKEWRLYFKGGRSSKFFEIDIERCLGDIQRFKYFYALFRPDAFIKDSSGRCLLDYIFEQSLRFQEDVEKDLREKVFKCVELLGQGFLLREENHLTEKDLDSIYHYSLSLLYRILFVLNAEARDLLSTNPQTKYYKHYGLQRIKDRVRREKGEFINAKTTLYDELLALFHLINGDNEKLNKDLKIPRYNGGLFDPEKYSFLEEKKVGDDVLSDVIYELAYRIDKNGEEHRIDYKGLGERHLGTVYEGLLEHKFSFDNGKVVLKNDKGERKATGAYYTPDYIVKYIVENTLGPILKEINEEISSLPPSLETTLLPPSLEIIPSHPPLVKGGRGDYKDDSFAGEVLNLNICDPAMGSGHFLVEAVQYLADEIAYHPTTQLKTLKGEAEDEVNYWKRKVVESCIYGVDIKELAVELAKLSLWLKTVDRSQPLNFLDHHLRCGNSLIGARISDLNYLPQPKGKKKSDIYDEQLVLFDTSKFREDITSIVKGFQSIEDMPSENLSDIKTKEKTFKILTDELNKYREIADLWTSLFFGNSLEEKEQVFEELLKDQYKFQLGIFGPDTEIVEKKKVKIGMSNKIYNFIVCTLQSPDGKEHIAKLSSLLENSETIARERKFFHWELEFPEVFFNEDGSPKENPGFDCVIGNPPYGAPFDSHQKIFLNEKFITAEYQLESFTIFIEQALSLLKQKGFQSYITPTTWLSMHYFENLRTFLLSNNQLQQVILFKESVFEDATVETCIEIVNKKKPDTKTILMLGVVSDKPENLNIKCVELEQKRVERFEGKRITEYLTPNLLDLFDKTRKASIYLKDIANICNGLKPYEVGKGIPPQTKEVVKNRIFDTDFKKDDTYKPYLRGEDFFKYSFILQKPRWISYGEWLAAPRPTTPFFAPKKIIIRQTSDTLIATIDDEQYLNLNNVHNLVLKSENYSLEFILSLLNSKLLSFIHRVIVPEFGRVFAEVKIVNLEKLPIPHISFTTSEKERKERVSEAIELYKNYMLDFEREGKAYEKTEISDTFNRAVERKTLAGGKETALSGEYSRPSKRLHGVRRRTRKPKNAERVSEDIERYPSTTRFIESSLGIKSYSELAPHLAKGVERVMAHLLQLKPHELKVTSEFICKLHKDAFGELFPSWAGRYRDRNVTVSKHTPPPYFEVPVLMRQYCEDLESRLSTIGEKPPVTDILLETLSFAEGRLLSIHPFLDFNGRVARMLLFALLYRLDLPPVQLVPTEGNENEKTEYLNALSEADYFNWQPLINIWKKRLGMKE